MVFGPPYTASSKEPDQYIPPHGLALPTVVVESGWTEPRPHFSQDKSLWLTDGAGAV